MEEDDLLPRVLIISSVLMFVFFGIVLLYLAVDSCEGVWVRGFILMKCIEQNVVP